MLWGELGEHVVDQLAALSSGVMLPLLSNAGNSAGLPLVLAHEVTENLHHFITTSEPPIYLFKSPLIIPPYQALNGLLCCQSKVCQCENNTHNSPHHNQGSDTILECACSHNCSGPDAGQDSPTAAHHGLHGAGVPSGKFHWTSGEFYWTSGEFY